jgi:uncharacterized protein (DUF486 family)
MNPPGVGHEAGETARSAISALSSAPVILALVLLQAGVLGMMAWYSHERTKSNDRILVAYQEQFRALLERCDGK